MPSDTQTQEAQTEVQQAQTNEQPAQETEQKKLDTDQIKKRRYFSPDQKEHAVSYLNLINQTIQKLGLQNVGQTNVDMASNEQGVITDITLPEGSGLMIRPIMSRENKDEQGKMTVADIVIASVPDITTLANDEGGAAFLQDIVEDAFARKVASMFNQWQKAKDSGMEEAFALPANLAEWITKSTRGAGLEAWNAVGADSAKELRGRGLKSITTKDVLRAILMSAEYAKDQYPKINQAVWVAIINKCKEESMKQGHPGDLFDQWIATRDERILEHEEVEAETLADLGL